MDMTTSVLISIREDSYQLPAEAVLDPRGYTLIDVKIRTKEIRAGLSALPVVLGLALPLCVALPLSLAATSLLAQAPIADDTPPPSTGGFFPLGEVHKGLMGTAWTVFQGSKPEPMQVEILGVLRGARGPGQDMILAQLHGAHPEYTGVVAGMSGSPVYIGKRLLGSLSYRIGEFSKDPIAGITPIAQMLEVRDLTMQETGMREQETGIREKQTDVAARGIKADGMNFQAMETPLVITGLRPEAIRLWQQQMAGTGLATVAAGGASSGSGSSSTNPPPWPPPPWCRDQPSALNSSEATSKSPPPAPSPILTPPNSSPAAIPSFSPAQSRCP